MSRFSTCALLIVCLAVAGGAGLTAQATIYVPDINPTVPGGTSVNTIPFGNTTGYTYMGRIPASFMDPNNTRVDDVRFAPGLSAPAGIWNAANALVAIGHVPATLPCPFTFPGPGGAPAGSFNDLTVVYDSAIHGPLNWTWIPGAWSPLGLPVFGAQPFVWNGFDDVGVYVTFASSTFGSGFLRNPSGPPDRTYSASYQAPASSACGSSFGIVIALDVSPNGNILSVTQSGPGVGDLTISLTMISGTALEGWTLLSGNTSAPKGSGPFIGLVPDQTTWTFLGIPYFIGNPVHFHTIDVGFFPTVPFVAGPGSVSVLNGLTFDFSVLLLTALGQYDSRSNVERVTFQ
jgi:hypothetical protein